MRRRNSDMKRISLIFSAASQCAAGHLTLWDSKPAGKWEEALPVGNGRLGAMVFDGVTN